VIILNSIISFVIVLAVIWVFEARRPDPEELAALGSAGATVGSATPRVVIDLPPTATSPAIAAESTGETGDAAPTPASAEEEDGVVHIVQPGESVSSIAGRYGVTLASIVAANNMENPDFVFSGQRLVIPVGGLPTPTPAWQATGVTGLKIRAIAGAGDLANEYVEIVNDTDLTFNLQGWRLQRDGGPEYTFGDLLIFPGGSVRLYSTSGTDSTIVRYWAQSASVWQTGAQATLVNAQGDGVATFQTP
jgi:LysM repeat protein